MTIEVLAVCSPLMRANSKQSTILPLLLTSETHRLDPGSPSLQVVVKVKLSEVKHLLRSYPVMHTGLQPHGSKPKLCRQRAETCLWSTSAGACPAIHHPAEQSEAQNSTEGLNVGPLLRGLGKAGVLHTTPEQFHFALSLQLLFWQGGGYVEKAVYHCQAGRTKDNLLELVLSFNHGGSRGSNSDC